MPLDEAGYRKVCGVLVVGAVEGIPQLAAILQERLVEGVLSALDDKEVGSFTFQPLLAHGSGIWHVSVSVANYHE